MEQEVFVPVPAARLDEVLDDPSRVARAVPGLQQDAGAEPVAGRLKVRVGSHSITYRGSVRVSRRDDGSHTAEGTATEARGTGTVRLALTLRVRDTDGGSALTFTGTAAADGRITELPPAAVATALTRLLTRFGENLGAAAEQERPPETAESLATEDFAPAAAADFDAAPDADDAPVPAPADDSVPEGDTGHLADHASVFDTEVPPPSLDPAAQEDGDAGDPEEFAPVMEPPAEAAHARRTMIGRSAEEVDHAPPRGRYAPVPAPETVSAATSLRWAAPAAALVVASAIVVGRALRKRR